MKILVSGASGLIGSALLPRLREHGHEPVPLSRSGHDAAAAWWDPQQGSVGLERAGKLDAVIHLAGENIGTRWSASKKKRIRESRVQGTHLLSRALAGLPEPPAVLVSASATGFYGDRGEEWLEEGSAAGTGYLCDLCQDWEAATAPAAARGIRVVCLRTGLVLAEHGGALARMLQIFRPGLGGRVGSGRQYWSWIALEDVLGVLEHLLQTESISGPVNNVAPTPVTNLEFTRTLGRVLDKPTVLPVPAWAARAALGEMAEATLLASQRVRPQRLQESGYRFIWPELGPALEQMLGSGKPTARQRPG